MVAKNLDDEIKTNKEKAKKSQSYRFAAINQNAACEQKTSRETENFCSKTVF